MTAVIWSLLFDNKKESEPNVKARRLVVWRCKEPTLLSTQDDDELQDYLLKIDFHNKEQVVKLSSRAKVVSLELGKREVLLVQVIGVISNSSFFSCSQLHSLAATNLRSKKQKLEKESPLTNFIKGENWNFLTV